MAKAAVRRPAAVKEPKEPRKKFGRMDVTLFFLIIVLLAFGLVMVFSASYATSLKEEGSSFAIVTKQALVVGAGVFIMLVASYVDYHIYRNFKWVIYAVSLLLMVYALTFPHESGARRWFYIGTISVQPSEIMKFSMIVMFAHLIALNQKRMDQFKFGAAPFVLILAPIMLLMGLQRHLSGLVIMIAIGHIMAFIGGGKIIWYAMLGGAGVLGAAGLVIWKGFGYITTRFNTWLDPFQDIRDGGWQIVQSLYAIGSGGLFGVGLGNSTQKFLYISEPQNDFIFAIICEEFGFFGALLVILLFIFFVYEGLSVAMRAADKFGTMMAIGLTIQIGLQALLNIAVVTNSIPTTGVSLPFFSAGGTATLMQLAQMGVLLNISRQGVHKD